MHRIPARASAGHARSFAPEIIDARSLGRLGHLEWLEPAAADWRRSRIFTFGAEQLTYVMDRVLDQT